MSEHIKTLIKEVISLARERGLAQGELAENAGLTGVGLSKAKHRGDIRASLLDQLGNQLDLELAFVPRRSREKAVKAIKQGAFFRISPDKPDASGGEG